MLSRHWCVSNEKSIHKGLQPTHISSIHRLVISLSILDFQKRKRKIAVALFAVCHTSMASYSFIFSHFFFFVLFLFFLFFFFIFMKFPRAREYRLATITEAYFYLIIKNMWTAFVARILFTEGISYIPSSWWWWCMVMIGVKAQSKKLLVFCRDRSNRRVWRTAAPQWRRRITRAWLFLFELVLSLDL